MPQLSAAGVRDVDLSFGVCLAAWNGQQHRDVAQVELAAHPQLAAVELPGELSEREARGGARLDEGATRIACQLSGYASGGPHHDPIAAAGAFECEGDTFGGEAVDIELHTPSSHTCLGPRGQVSRAIAVVHQASRTASTHLAAPTARRDHRSMCCRPGISSNERGIRATS
jgi:hypothetical protein